MSVKKQLSGLLFAVALGAYQVAVVPARADEEQLQRQINAMKRQLDAMQRELAQSRKQSAQQRAGSASQQAVTARNGNEVIIPPAAPPPAADGGLIPTKAVPAWFDGIHVSMAGSFIALEGACANTAKCQTAQAIRRLAARAFPCRIRLSGMRESSG